MAPANIVETSGGQFLTVKGAAEELGISVTGLQDWVRLNRFPHIKYEGKRLVRIPREWFDRFVSGELAEEDLEVVRVGRTGRICRPIDQSKR